MILDWLTYGAFFLVTAASFGIMALGLNLQWGQTGLFNVGVAGFAAIGAYASALLTAAPATGRLGGYELPFAIGWLGAVAASGVVAALIGAITLRLRADYLAITTFGIAIVIQLVAVNAEWLTGGPFGIAFIPRPFAVLQENALAFNLANLLLASAVTGAVYLTLERLTRGPWGRVLRAIREDEAAAASLGKDARLYRLQAFVIGCMIIGLGGAMQAQAIGFIAPENYLSALTFQVWAMLIVGGAGNNRGALLGALAIWGLWSLSSGLVSVLLPAGLQARAASLQLVLIGVLIAAILILRPRGLLGEPLVVSRYLLQPKE
jgi:branched-chain amino acid transport system permease protein